ncbi:Susd2 [Acrasis kona]|uniref:Susd2 n=1 Tax=Acrasis kona TaxID=1008807 RepID=A0AAW2YT63_9EUKA
MRFTLALLLVLVILAATTLAKTEYEKKCTKIPLKCKKISVCLKAQSKCVEHRETPTKVCVKYQEVIKRSKVAYCKKYAKPVKDKCGNTPAGPKVCLETGFKTKTVVTKKCVKRGVKRYCHKHKNVCLKKKTKKVCQKIIKKPKITGPKTCKAGEFMKFVVEGNHTKRVCTKVVPKKVVYKTCTVYNDPHFTAFKGDRFDYHAEGDFNLAETADGLFKVHGTFKRFDNQAWTGIVGAAILVNGKDVVEVKDRVVYLNKKVWSVAENQLTYVPENRGGSVLLTKNDFTIISPNQAKVQLAFSTFGNNNIFNINVFVDKDDSNVSKGLCAEFSEENKKPVTGLTRKVTVAKTAVNAYKVKKFDSATDKKNAKIQCLAAGASKKDLDNCVSDLAQASNPKHKVMVLAVYKKLKSNKKVALNAVLPLGTHKHKGAKSSHKKHKHHKKPKHHKKHKHHKKSKHHKK